MNNIDTVDLKPITSDDLELVLSWRNQKHIRDVMFNDKVVIWEDHIEWFNKIIKDNDVKIFLFYLQDVPLGLVNFKIDRLNEKCEWGFYIGSKSAPKGAGTLMGITALNYIFNELNIRKVCAEVLDFNRKSLSFHEKLGFVNEGMLVKHIKRSDQYIDIYLLALFKEQWETAREKIKLMIEGN